jgi:hypothetical protein
MAERLNFGQACQHAGVSRQRLNEAIRSGRLPAERGGGPGKPTYICLEDLQAWCVSEGLAMPVEALERSERLKLEEFPVFLKQFHNIMEMMTRLEGTIEQTIERLERSQAQAIEHGLTRALAQLNIPLPLERSGTSSEASDALTLNREAIIARIRQAKDKEGKSYQKIANELNVEGIPTMSGRGTWQKGNVERLYKAKKE